MPEQTPTLLQEKNKADILKGLSKAVKSELFLMIPQITALIGKKDQDIANASKAAVVALSRKCLEKKGEAIAEAITSIAAKTLQKFDPDYITKHYANLKSDNPDVVVNSMIISKFFIPEQKAEEVIKQTLKHPNDRVRATAILHIGIIAAKVSGGVLTKFLEDSDNRVKANTIEVLEKINNKVFIRVISRFRSDKNNRIRANALKALFNLGEKEIRNDLEIMLDHSDAFTRSSAIWVIGEIGKKALDFIELLRKVIDDEDEIIKRNLIVVYKKLGNIPETEFIQKHLKEEFQKQVKDRIINAKDLQIKHAPTKHYYELKLKGVITANTILNLKFILNDLMNREKFFILNMKDVEYIDSSGLGLIINFNKTVKAKDGYLYLHSLNHRVTDLFQISKLYNTVINVFESIQEIRQFLNIGS